MISFERLQSRIARFVEDWPTKFPRFDAVLLVSGSQESFVLTPKTISMHNWLFGAQLTRTVVVLHRFGRIIVWASHNKLAYFEQCVGPTCVKVHRISQSCVEEDTLNFKFIVNLLRIQADDTLVLGILENEIPEDSLGKLVCDVLPTLPRVRSENCDEGVSSLLVKKDAEEKMLIKGSSLFASAVLKKLRDRVLEVVDENMMITNAEVQLCSLTPNLRF